MPFDAIGAPPAVTPSAQSGSDGSETVTPPPVPTLLLNSSRVSFTRVDHDSVARGRGPGDSEIDSEVTINPGVSDMNSETIELVGSSSSDETPSTVAGVNTVIDQDSMKSRVVRMPIEPSVVMVPENPYGDDSNRIGWLRV